MTQPWITQGHEKRLRTALIDSESGTICNGEGWADGNGDGGVGLRL